MAMEKNEFNESVLLCLVIILFGLVFFNRVLH